MMNDYVYATFIDVELDGKDLKLRLKEELRARGELPILRLELRRCRGAAAGHMALLSWVGHTVEVWFAQLDDDQAAEFLFDYHAEADLTIHFGEASSTRDAYSLADLTLLYNGLMDAYQLEANRHSQSDQRFRRILSTVRREVAKTLDRSRQKSTFYDERDEPLRQAEFEGEAHACQRVLNLLDRLTNDS